MHLQIALLTSITVGLIPAFIAHSKGYSFMLWWLYGAGLFIIALVHILLTAPTRQAVELRNYRDGLQKCPQCAEFVNPDAQICRYCGFQLRIRLPNS